MHVSRILGELDVQSREEAAAWWLQSRGRVPGPLRAMIPFGGLKLVAGSAATLAIVVGAGTAMLWYANPGDGEELPDARAELPERRYRLTEVSGDSVNTFVTIQFTPPLSQADIDDIWMFLTDGTGSRIRAQQRLAIAAGSLTFQFANVGEVPAEISVELVRIYSTPGVVIDFSQPIPTATPGATPMSVPNETIVTLTWPWNGPTSPTQNVQLPELARLSLGSQIVVLDEIVQAQTRTIVRWHFENEPPNSGKAGANLAVGLALLDANGQSAESLGGTSGRSAGERTESESQYSRLSGLVTLRFHLAYHEFAAQPYDFRVAMTADEKALLKANDGAFAEFHFELP